MASSVESVVAALRSCGGRIVYQNGQAAEVKRQALQAALFNGAIEPGGLAVIECGDEAAMQSAVRVAADCGVPLAVLAGGHDLWARGLQDGNVILDVRRMSSVSADPAARVLRALASLPGARLLYQRWSAYKDTFSEQAEKAWPKGRHYHLLTRTLGRLDAAAIHILVEGARRMPGPSAAIAVHDFHGTPADIPSHATAFALRENHFVVEVIAQWDHSAERDHGVHVGWVEQLDAELSRIALPGGYTNLLKPSDTARVREFYGASCARLLEIKRRVDPDDLFRSGVGRLG